MCRLHIYSTLLGIVWGSKCQWTWSCSHLCWNIMNPSCNHKQWLDLAWASHSSQQVSIPFEIASSVPFQRHKARIHFSSRYMLVFMMLMPSDIISHKEAISAKSYEKCQLNQTTYSVYWSLPSPVESKNRIRWRQHMSLTLSIPLSLNSYFESQFY